MQRRAFLGVVWGIVLGGISWSWAADAPRKPETPPSIRDVLPRTFRSTLNPQPPPLEVRVNIDKFFTRLTEGNSVKAYEELMTGQPLAERKEQVEHFVRVTQEALGLYGKVNSYEVIDNYPVGSRLISMTYLSAHQRVPIRWRFLCYKPDKVWLLIDIQFDDGFKDWFD